MDRQVSACLICRFWTQAHVLCDCLGQLRPHPGPYVGPIHPHGAPMVRPMEPGAPRLRAATASKSRWPSGTSAESLAPPPQRAGETSLRWQESSPYHRYSFFPSPVDDGQTSSIEWDPQSARTTDKRGAPRTVLCQATDRACFMAHWGRGGGYSVLYHMELGACTCSTIYSATCLGV